MNPTVSLKNEPASILKKLIPYRYSGITTIFNLFTEKWII